MSEQGLNRLPAAEISGDGIYRYFLKREWDLTLPAMTFIGLNPSTADAIVDDPTIRRCVRFVRDWGGGALYMVNLFAYRSTDHRVLRRVSDPIGPENDAWIAQAIHASGLAVAAWGNQGVLFDRGRQISLRYPGTLHRLTTTANGMPGHPLYVSASMRPMLPP